MQIDSMLTESIQLLVLGMGTVFFILLLLIVCLSLIASLVSRPANVADSKTSTSSNINKSNTAISMSGIAAIQAAIHFYHTASNR